MKKSIEDIKADYHLFIDVQMGKYLRNKNKSAFSNDEEANLVMNEIVEAYNQKIASDHLRLNNLNEAAKASWFNSFEIDFAKPNSIHPLVEVIPGINKVTKDFIAFYNNLFPFLLEGAIAYLLNAGPALEAYGYPFERFQKIIEGNEPTEIEEDLLLWAYDLSFEIAKAYLEKSKIEKDKLIDYAISIAEEELDEETAVEVVSEIYENYKENFADLNKNKQSSKKKRGK